MWVKFLVFDALVQLRHSTPNSLIVDHGFSVPFKADFLFLL